MNSSVLPELIRATLARVRVRGVPRLLLQTRRFVLGESPAVLRVAGGYHLHIDPRDGDQCMMYYGVYGTGILHFAERIVRPGDTVIDLGGQIGFFAGAFAQLVGSEGRVVTFEPDPRVWPRLMSCVEHNAGLPITAKNAAAAATSGTATLHVSPTAGWSTLMDCDYPEVESVEVRTHALDDLTGDPDLRVDRLRLIKLDVEGAEIGALQGMRSVLREARPYLICEMNEACLRDSDRTPDELLRLLDELDYSVEAITEPGGVFRNTPPKLTPIHSAANLPWSVGDLLCTPRGAS